MLWFYFFGGLAASNSGIGLILFVFVFIISLKINLKNLISSPVFIWLFWTIYSIINLAFISEYTNDINISFLGFIILPLVLITYTITIKPKNYLNFIQLLKFAMFFRLTLALVFDGFSSDFGGLRFGITYNANMIAFTALFLIFLIFLKSIIIKKFTIFDIFLILFSILFIYITASRKSFVILTILFYSAIYIFSSGNFIKKSVKLTYGSIAITSILFLVFNDSLVIQRILETYSTTKTANTELDMFDGRAIQYVNGLEVFNDNNITGIGLNNYIQFDEWNLVLHSEYLVQLVENGLIGFSLYIIFILSIINKLLKLRKIQAIKKESQIYLLYYFCLIILSFGTWTYSIILFWIIISLSIRFIYINQKFLK